MRHYLLPILLLTAAIGCAVTPLPTSERRPLPVPILPESTNSTLAVSALEAAARLNDSYNATASREPLSIIIGSALTAAASAAGWFARHRTKRLDPPS